jgi:DNA-nicking Smr family endonuclease
VSARPRSVREWVDPIEPGRKRRLTRERDPIDGRIDLHGLGQFAAEDRLKAYLRFAQAQGMRAVLVITGKGVSGDGIIRRRAPEWLADPALRDVVAGVSGASRRHGGEGALYVALKRRA